MDTAEPRVTADPSVLAAWPAGAALSRERWMATLLSLACVAVLTLLVCLQFGAEAIGLRATLQILGETMRHGQAGLDATGATGVILMHVRLPRILLGFLVGASLAAVGGALQALLRNPLADPYVLGISSGAALGASLAVLLGLEAGGWGLSVLPLCAFSGALLSIFLVYRIAAAGGRLPIHTLLLAGVILNAIFSALIMFATSMMTPAKSFGMMAWLMGSLTGLDYTGLLWLSLYAAVGLIILFRLAETLNLMTLGEESARSLGVNVDKVKKILFVTAALLTGAVVSVSGLIGFVGMVIPHVVRLLFGPDHRLLLPACALVGGVLLTAADTVARTALAPAEFPVGVVTALVGGPFFIYLLISRKGGVIG